MLTQIVRRLAPLFFVALLAVSAGFSQSLAPELVERVDRVISTEMARRNIPGLTIAIAVGDAPVWSKGYGFADLENFVPATERSRYRLASISKPITAVALLELVEAGKAGLEDDVRKYVPEFPPKAKTVTLRQLLGHLGGIRSYKGDEMESTKYYGSIRGGLEIFAKDPLAHAPGSKYLYSSYGFNLAGAAAESIAGKPFRELLTSAVFQPAGMLQTRDDSHFAVIPNRVAGYRKNKAGEIENCALADTSNKVPGGGLIATAPDVARFGQALASGKLVSARTRTQMWTSQKTSDGKETGYGMGWHIETFEGKRRVNHGGAQPGTSTFLDLLPDDHIVVAVLTNVEGANPKTISEAILRMLISSENTQE